MTPSEIKLLQLASKGADFISVEPDPEKPVEGLMMVNWTIWNPLTSDTDALALAMTLVKDKKIRIQVQDHCIDIFEHWDGVWVPHSWTIIGKDHNECFREAVVHVAAEIGKRL